MVVTAGKQLRLDLDEQGVIGWSVDQGPESLVATGEAVLGLYSALVRLPERWTTLRLRIEQGKRRRFRTLTVR